MPIFEIRLLGAPTVYWNGDPLPIVRRQTRILLYRLADPGPPLTREHLCFLFWPDVPEGTAARNLSHLLTHLRQALPDGDVVATSDDQVYLDPGSTWSDVGEFLRLRNSRDGRCDVERLARAVALYRGPFLDGVSAPHNPDYESWMMLERRTLERRYRDTLHALVEEFSRSGDYDRAIRYANRYLEIDPLDESIHQRLMALYAARGDRGAALQQYRQCEDLLERELGVCPLPETCALHQSVLRSIESTARVQASPSRWTTLAGPRVPLVGREDVWQELQRLYARACAGTGCVALVRGEAGIGKSRLLEQFVTQSPARALVAAGQPGTESVPFHVLVQAIRPQLRIDERSGSLLNVSLQGVSPVWIAEAAYLLPELSGDQRVATFAHANILDGSERPQRFECLSRFVQAFAAYARPAILCLDNLNWADDETLEWLAYFAPQLQRTPVLVLAAYRSEEGAKLLRLRQGLSRLGLLTEIELRGLTKPQVDELLRHLLDRDAPDGRLAGRLLEATGGNPFSLIQVTTALAQSGLPPQRWADVEELPAPTALCAAVTERIDALDPVTRQVVEACAVLAPVFGFDLVRLTSGRRELETLDSLEKLVARGLLECHGAEYRFRQALLHRVLEKGMSPMRRQLLHRRAGRALEQINRYAFDALARHYAAGDEPAKAAHFRELANQRAEALLAMQEEDHGAAREHELPQRRVA